MVFEQIRGRYGSFWLSLYAVTRVLSGEVCKIIIIILANALGFTQQISKKVKIIIFLECDVDISKLTCCIGQDSEVKQNMAEGRLVSGHSLVLQNKSRQPDNTANTSIKRNKNTKL